MMPRIGAVVVAVALAFALIQHVRASDRASVFIGFDRNDYPGDDNLEELHKTFAFTGFWLNNPPGSKSNTWVGTRGKLEAAGFGFLVLFNGRLYRELKANATELGRSDGRVAIASARREAFQAHTIIFLDQEEGGRMLPEQKEYLFAWVDEVARGGFRAGVYCSGIPFKEKSGASVVTAEDIRLNAAGRDITFWVTNDACPSSPGCAASGKLSQPKASGIDFAEVWQFAQSPRRKDVAGTCRGYAEDGECDFPMPSGQRLRVDLDVATSSNPSRGKTGER